MKTLDFRKMIDTDDIDDALDNLKGVTVLIRGLMYLHNDAGSATRQREAFLALESLCDTVIEDFEDMKPKIDYMQTEIRKDK